MANDFDKLTVADQTAIARRMHGRAVASILGITPRTMRGLGVAKDADGRYSLGEVVAAYCDSVREKYGSITAIPRSRYCRISGTQWQVIDRQVTEFGVPIRGDDKTVNVEAVISWLHLWLRDNGNKLRRIQEGAGDSISQRLERVKLGREEERLAMARLDRLEREERLLPRNIVRTVLARLALLLRNAGESLQRQHGPDAALILNNALDDFEREAEALKLIGQDVPSTPSPEA